SAGAQALAMYDANAAQIVRAGEAQEVPESRGGLGGIHSMQVDFGSDAILTASQPPQHRFRYAGAPEDQLIAGLNLIQIGADAQTLLQYRCALRARELGAGPDRAPRGMYAL